MFHVKHLASLVEKFDIYLEKLKFYNQKFNLTGLKEDREIIIKHFLDSLSLAKFYNFNNQTNFIDIGTGAGFPGVPLLICFPNNNLVLVESNQKKVDFLKHLCENLFRGEKMPLILRGRAEDLVQNNFYQLSEKFDLVLARAVAKFERVIFWALPFLRIGGIYLAQLGPQEKITFYQKLVSQIGGQIEEVFQYSLPFSDYSRIVLKIKKLESKAILSPAKIKAIIKSV